MSKIPTRQLPARQRRSAIDETLYLLEGEGISSPEPQEEANDSFETIPLGNEIPTTVPKENDNEDILLLMYEFVKRIFFAIFDEEISLYVNFKGRKTKERLSGSKLYEVILEVFGAWNTDRSVKLSDLESAITKRLKRSLDSYVQRKKHVTRKPR
nr:unnamed protein product [Spirometra erinaceieuropaei]